MSQHQCIHFLGWTWSEGPLLQKELQFHCMSELDENRIIIAGGMEGSDASYTSSSFILHLTDQTYSRAGFLTRRKRMPISCALYKNRLYLVAKERNSHFSETEMFDLDTKMWIEGPSFPNQIEGRPTLAKIQNKLFCSDSDNLYQLYHHESHIKWVLVKSVKGQKSREHFIPLSVLILEINPNNDNNICKFPIS